MVLKHTPICDFGAPAIDFNLLNLDNNHYTLSDVKGKNGLLVMFICNHCPFVKAIENRLVEDTKVLLRHDIGVVAIMSNDPAVNEEDSFENMKKRADSLGYPFPYLYDETQAVAKAYDAICTPDFFGYNADLQLQYRGRLDASGRDPSPADAPRELVDAMLEIARTGKGPKDQTASMGCSIKWRQVTD